MNLYFGKAASINQTNFCGSTNDWTEMQPGRQKPVLLYFFSNSIYSLQCVHLFIVWSDLSLLKTSAKHWIMSEMPEKSHNMHFKKRHQTYISLIRKVGNETKNATTNTLARIYPDSIIIHYISDMQLLIQCTLSADMLCSWLVCSHILEYPQLMMSSWYIQNPRNHHPDITYFDFFHSCKQYRFLRMLHSPNLR